MPSRLYSATLVGIDAKEVEIEADISRGIKSYVTVGLPDAAVKESRERVKSAVANSGFSFPDQVVTPISARKAPPWTCRSRWPSSWRMGR
jgi:magnesium chelatase family protein